MKNPAQPTKAQAGFSEGADAPNSTGEPPPDSAAIVLTGADAPRVDSRLIAQALGNQLKDFGKLPFEMEALPSGQKARYYLLNEDQSFFLLTLSRNTKRVVDLKANLVRTFREARLKAELHTEYLPGYHDLHDQLHRLAGGSSNERWAHVNLNKLVNRTAGIEAGQRAQAGFPHKAILIAAQHLAAQAMQGATDHHDGYARAKKALEPLQALGGPITC